MVTFGLDISHHQNASLNLRRCKEESGLEFVILKCSEGADFIDSAFKPRLAEAESADMLTAAYHYIRSNATAAAQVANVAKIVPRGMAVIPDIEANSGGVALAKDFVARLLAAGYKVPLTYLPRWYWQQIGSPSLVGLPSLWSSRYPDNVADSLAKEYAAVPRTYWDGYGGLGVKLLQFTSSLRIPSYTGLLDANAFLGTRNELAVLFGGEEEEDMSMYDKVKWTLTDGTVIEKTHSEILAAWFEANFITERAPEHDGKRETMFEAVWENRSRVEAAKKLISDFQVGLSNALREALENALTDNPPTVKVDAQAIAEATIALMKKEGN